ncbi:DoxX family protein [Peterkaempfera bronchialis]|uniref:DoxX family protein n=1 Tax=Peterkaempfera bronchialis TaxID=2126346 RepID=A0A345SR21_9ACTN|nr:DoxX family protein [Peterkaempfera bronchialis]AXI76176.1 DoxX family protein [Peterkaempfera bronchialis]
MNRTERGTDAAALLLRATLGPMLVAHGWNKVRGPGGLDGTTGWFRALGLEPAAVHARLAAATELAAGAAITVGAGGPFPSAAAVGLMGVAARTDHRGKGFFVFKGGWEYTAVVAGAAVAAAALGPGRWSADGLLHGRIRGGTGAALTAALLGAGGAAALLRAAYRPQRTEGSTGTAEETA